MTNLTLATQTATWSAPLVRVSAPAVRYYVAWDDMNPDYGNKCRTVMYPHIKAKSPPAVYRFYPEPREQSGDYRVNLSSPYDWKPAIVALNGGGEEGLRDWGYLVGPARASYNSTGWPMQAYITFSGNELRGEMVGNWFRFVTLRPSDLPSVAGMTIQSCPWFVHRFTCVGWDGQNTKRIESTNTLRGQVHFYLVTKEGAGYIPARHVVRMT
jgi:hypothetical protein